MIFRSRDGLDLALYHYIGSGPELFFYHANGFSANTYRTLLQSLTPYFDVWAADIRGHGESDVPERLRDWGEVRQDLIDILDHLDIGPVIALGHSLGAVTSIMASVHRPDLFNRIIGLDPVIFSRPFLFLVKFMRLTGLKNKMPPVAVALRRRDIWDSREQIMQVLRRKKVFRKVNEDYLKNYVEYAFREEGNKLHLSCPKKLEADIYAGIPYSVWSYLRRLSVPLTIVRGGDSDTLSRKAYLNALQMSPMIKGIEVPGLGHLLPMENEEKVIDILLKCCRKKGWEAH